MRVGTICYATEQGIGYLPKWFYDAGIITDVAIFRHSSRETHRNWYPPHQHGYETIEYSTRPFKDHPCTERFLSAIDIMLFFETPFDWDILRVCKKMGVKTAIVPMYECTPTNLPTTPDLWICPSLLDCQYFPGFPMLEIPVPADVVWKERHRAERFLHNGGNLGLRGHKGTLEILKAWHLCKKPIDLTVRAQDTAALREVLSKANFDLEQRMFTWGFQSSVGQKKLLVDMRPASREELFSDHDAFIMAEKYNGLSLPLREARAAGMLVMTSDRFPMNTWLPTRFECGDCGGVGEVCMIYPHTPYPQSPETGTIEVCSICKGKKEFKPLIPVERYSTQRVAGPYNWYQEAEVSPVQIAAKMDEMYGADIAQYSLQGKEWADRMSWEGLKPLWLEELQKCLS